MVSLDLRSSAAEVMGVVTWTLRAADGVDDVQKLWRPHAADFVFEAFSTQCDAFRFADARAGLGLQVYASDKSQSGAKTYIAATYRGFWREYKRMCPSHRHMAEIIREGAPCRLTLILSSKSSRAAMWRRLGLWAILMYPSPRFLSPNNPS